MEKEEYMLILMDIQIPVMDGLEAAQRIRKLPTDNNNTVIVGVSANSDIESEQEAIVVGMDDFLPKPLPCRC